MGRGGVPARTSGEPFRARETVATETPDCAASCWIVVISETFTELNARERKRFRKPCQGSRPNTPLPAFTTERPFRARRCDGGALAAEPEGDKLVALAAAPDRLLEHCADPARVVLVVDHARLERRPLL